MKKLIILFIFILQLKLSSQTISWSSDIGSIIYSKCTSCHRTGGIAPFTLESYEEVVRRPSSIQNAINSQTMPPWPPDNNYSKFAHDRSLSIEQKTKIIQWLNNGMPRGDIQTEPGLPVFPNNGDLPGTPDLVLNAPLFNIHATRDIYQCFVVKNPNTVEKFIQAMEVIPGNRNAVHHVLIFYDKTGQAKIQDDATLEPGYLSFGGIGVSGAELIGAWVPGSAPQMYPARMGVKLPSNGDIVLQIHYPASSDGQMDQTMLKIYYSKEANTRQVFISPILNHDISLTNGPLVIPGNSIKTFNAEFPINNLKYTVLGVAPHMHLIGKSIEVYAENSSAAIQKLIKINNWDFHWQGNYSFPKPIILRAGTKLKAIATYDNTANNPNNPNSPPKRVQLGEATTDEMMLVYFTFLLYQNGDENIVIDSSALLNANTFDKESKQDFHIIKLANNQYKLSIDHSWTNSLLCIYNLEGRCIKVAEINNTEELVNLPAITSGILYWKLRKGNQEMYCKIFVE